MSFEDFFHSFLRRRKILANKIGKLDVAPSVTTKIADFKKWYLFGSKLIIIAVVFNEQFQIMEELSSTTSPKEETVGINVVG